MISLNPYNCARPGNAFVGFDKLRSEILDGLINGHSYAIIGGRRCGKTSILMQLQQDIMHVNMGPYTPIAKLLDVQALGNHSIGRLFEEIYNLITEGLAIPPWQSGPSGRDYDVFLKHLHAAKSLLEHVYGLDWLAILLIDELDAAAQELKDDIFFNNLRNLLMLSPFHRHFRLITSGVGDMANLIRSGSPLNNLRSRYLGILDDNSTQQLIGFGFSAGLDSEGASELELLTGGHPYLMQGVLEKLWQNRTSGLNREQVREAARQFQREHNDFTRWQGTFGDPEHAIYHCLTEAKDGRLKISEIRQCVNSSVVHHIDDAVKVLSYHGIIDDHEVEELRIAGTMFKDWYAQHSPSNSLVSTTVPIISNDGNLSASATMIVTKKQFPLSGTVVISLHGIRTRGKWQKELASELGRASLVPEPLDYGFFGAIKLLWPSTRRRQIDWFLKEYTQVLERNQCDAPSIVAHSFGTYIVAGAMEIYKEIRFERIIFCGAIVRREYPWNDILNRGQYMFVLHDFGRRDTWARLVEWVVEDAGQSGLRGFEASDSGQVIQRELKEFRHSDYFYNLNYRKNWIPFLKGSGLDELRPTARPRGQNWKFRLVQLTLILLTLGLGWWLVKLLFAYINHRH